MYQTGSKKTPGFFVMILTGYDIECLEQAKAIIDKNNRMHHFIVDIAHVVGLSSTRLKAGFKVHYGSGLYGYLREQRMQLALQHLQHSNETIKFIAKRAGFKHTGNFTKAFKKRYGLTPGQKRRQLQYRGT